MEAVLIYEGPATCRQSNSYGHSKIESTVRYLGGRGNANRRLTTRQYARLVRDRVASQRGG